MNGETSELCLLTAAARNALKNGSALNYKCPQYVNAEKFVFINRNGEIIENSAEKWFERLKSTGLDDIFMLLPVSARDREIHGFSNSSGGCVACFYNSGEVTYFAPRWEVDKSIRLWNIEYFESEWDNAPKEKPMFEDNTDEFKKVLCEIAELAEKIDQSFWAGYFNKALDILENGFCDNDDKISELPEKNRRLFYAADKADVFGGMGSWNDSPPFYAEEKGLSDEYTRLSNELFVQIKLALLYAVNEF